MKNAVASVYPETGAGDFTRYDGNLQFYGRVNALLRPAMHVVDLGAGRGRQLEVENPFRRYLVSIHGKVEKLIGIDVDDAVLSNPSLDEAHVYDGGELPLGDESVDLIFSDWVLEHIENPEVFTKEISRVLKPGGWFCARTPHSLSYIAIASRMVPNRLHAKAVSKLQMGKRKDKDVFPTLYRLNTLARVRRFFPGSAWDNHSYTFSAEPAYHFNKTSVVRLMRMAQFIKAPFAGENLFVFVRKHGSNSATSDNASEVTDASTAVTGRLAKAG